MLAADLFCRVIDNLGDAAVCLRLARQWVTEHGLRVRLAIDRPALLAPLSGGSLPAGLDVLPWDDATFTDWQPAPLVVAAFACRLPAACRQAMAAQPVPPAFFNLEYLSAEDWVDGVHGLASLHPDGLRETFFVPGFGEGSGGLLRERDLLQERDAFLRYGRQAFLAGLGVHSSPGERLASLFCYPHAPVQALAEALAVRGGWRLLAPEGVRVEVPSRQGLAVQRIPFLPQPDYDRLLWSCDLNMVRGEDSVLRAHWAGRPLLWHIYPQEDAGAREAKLDAWLDRAGANASPDLADAVRAAHHGWNGRREAAPVLDALLDHLPAWGAHMRAWSDALATRTDLASGLLAAARRQRNLPT